MGSGRGARGLLRGLGHRKEPWPLPAVGGHAVVEERVSPARLGAAGGAARPVCGMGFVPLVRYSTSYGLSSVEFNLKDNGQKAR